MGTDDLKTMWIKGKAYRTKGGWKANVVWVNEDNSMYCIHQDEKGSSSLVFHYSDGVSKAVLGVYEPPTFGRDHPADLTTELWKE